MNWSDWEFIWRRQGLPIGTDADITMLRQKFEAQHGRMARALLVRDVAEASAGVLVSAVFAGLGWHMGKAGWPLAIAVALFLGVSGFFVAERIRSRRARVAPSASLLDKVDADFTELRHQRQLLVNVASWYLAPIFVGELIVVATVVAHAEPWAVQRHWIFLAGMIIFLVAVNWWVWALNRRAVRMQLDPRLAELEKLRSEILTDE